MVTEIQKHCHHCRVDEVLEVQTK